MTTTAHIDRRAVMVLAWAKTRAMGKTIICMTGLRRIFADMLRAAWAELKALAARPPRPAMTAAQATAAVSMVENKQRLTFADHAEINRLQGIIHAAATRAPAFERRAA